MAIDAGTVNAKIRVDTVGLRGDLAQANTAFSSFGKQMNVSALGMAKTWIQAFAGIGTAIGAVIAIVQGFKTAINTFASFEQAMANVGSVAKASAEDFALLNEAAAEAGRTTRFTASQAADALYYLASAGFTASQSINALNGVLELAGATGSDLASTSETVASTISQFGLEASEATRVANVFTAAITGSQANMEKLSTSLRYVGATAAAFNYELEDVVGLLQILYNNGYDASQAGTALRSTFADLANASSPAIAKLKELGITYDQVNPETNDFVDIIQTLSEAGLTAGEVMAIFGDRAGPAMITLLSAGREEIEKYTDAVTGTNAASVAYARQNDTLLGDIDRLKSATEGLAIAFGAELAPVLRDVIEIGIGLVGFLTEAIPYASRFFEIVLAPITSLAKLSAEMLKTKEAAAQFAPSLAQSAESIARVNQSIADISDLQGQADTINGLVEEYEALAEKTNKTEAEQKRLDEVVQELNKTVPQATEKFDAFGNAMSVNTQIAKDYSASLLDNAETIARSTLDSLKAEQQIAARRTADIERERAAAKKRYEETNANLKALEGQYKAVYAIETTLYADLAAAGENDGEARRAAYQKATQALLEMGLIGETEIDRMDEGARGLAEVWQISTGSILSTYRQLSNEAEKNLKTWQGYEEKARESDKLIQDIALAEENLNSILERKNALLTEGGTTEEDNATAEAEAAKRRAELAEEEAKRAEARKRLEEEYTDKLARSSGDRLAILEYEYRKAMSLAQQYGADVTVVEDYFAAERQKLIKEDLESKKGAIAAGLEAERAGLADGDKAFYDSLKARMEAVSGWYSAVEEIASDFFSALTDLYTSDIENQIEALDQQKNADLEALDEKYQARLEAAGLAEESEIEKAQRELEQAKQFNNEERIAEAQLALQKAQIDQQYQNEKAAIEEQAAKKEAELEYKMAMAKWQFQLASAIAQLPMTILNAATSGWQAPFPASPFVAAAFAATAAAAGGLQIAAISGAKPQKPQFATGGIVIPAGAGGADVTVAENGSPELLLNAGASGEAFLNSFADRIAERMGGRGGSVTVILEDMGYQIAKATAPYYENGQVRLRL